MKRTLSFGMALAFAVIAGAAAAGPPWRHGRSADGPAARPATAPSAEVTAAPTTQPAAMGRMGMGRRGGRGGMGPGGDMASIHSLISDHQKIQRTVEDIPGGVQTLTTSDDPKVAALLRQHVGEMKRRIGSGQPIRMWDPLFVELFRHREKVTMVAEDAPGGVKVVATSDDPQVALLIRQHARAGVSEFVAGGWDRVHKPTTLPVGYAATK